MGTQEIASILFLLYYSMYVLASGLTMQLTQIIIQNQFTILFTGSGDISNFLKIYVHIDWAFSNNKIYTSTHMLHSFE